MRYILPLLFLCLSPLAHAAYDGLATGVLTDRVVAKVNDQALTLSELDEAVVERRLADPDSRALPRRQLYEEELSRLIDEELIYQAATEAGVEAPPEMVAARVKESVDSLQQAAGSPEAMEAMLAAQGLTRESLQQLIQRREARQIVIVRAITARFTITEADVKEFEQAMRASGEAAIGYQLRHILIAVPETATPEEVRRARDQAFEAALKAQTEMTFAEAAQAFSQDALTRDLGGDLGYVAEGSMMPTLEKAVKELRVGQISQPVRSDTGWHVFKLENVSSPRKMLYARRFEEERLRMLAQLRRTMTIETQMEFLQAIPQEAGE